MSVIRAIIETTGQAHDVACDSEGHLLIGGVTLNGNVAVDMSGTNALLNSLIGILDPPGGLFQVEIPLTSPIAISSSTPLDVNIDSIDATAFPDGIPVRLESADDTLNLNVEVSALDPTAFPNGFPIQIAGINASAFLDGIPVTINAFNTTDFPNGIPVDLSGIDSSFFPDGIPVNVTTTSDPIKVKIDTTGGPSVIQIDPTQFGNLITELQNSANISLTDANGLDITAANPLNVTVPLTNYIRIGDNDGPLSSTNPLFTSTQLVDETGTVISAANPLDVAVTAQVTIDDQQLTNVITYSDINTGSTAREARPGIIFGNLDRRNPVLGGGETWRSFVLGLPKYTGIDGGTTSGAGSSSSWGFSWTINDGMNDTALQCLSSAVAVPEYGYPAGGPGRYIDGEVFFFSGQQREPSVRPLIQSDRGDLFVGHHFHTVYNSRSAPVEVMGLTPTRYIVGTLMGRVIPNTELRVGSMDGHLVVYCFNSGGVVGGGVIGIGVEWNPLRDSLAPDFANYWSDAYPVTANPVIHSPATITNTERNSLLRVPIMGRYCRLVGWPSGTVTSAAMSFHIDVHKGPY